MQTLQDTERRAGPRSGRRRRSTGVHLLVWVVLTALFAAGCGGSDEPEAVADDGTETAAGDGAETATDRGDADSDVEPWDQAVSAAWDEFQVVRTRAALQAVAALEVGEHRLDWTQAFLVEEGEGITALLAAWPAPPDDAALAESSAQLQTVLEEMQAANEATRAMGEADPDAVKASLDQVGEDLPAAPYGQAYVTYSEMDPELSEACFSLQEAMTAAGLELLDCTGSKVDTDAIGAELGAEAAAGSDDPGAEPTGLASEWEEGVHQVSVFEPGFTLDLARPLLVATTPDSVEISDPDDEDLSFVISPTTHVVDPAGLDADPGLAGSQPLPADLGPWLDELPIEVVEQGTIATGTGEIPYWRINTTPELMIQKVGEPTLLVLGGYGGPFDSDMSNVGVIPVLPVPDTTTVLIDWRRDDDRLLVHAVEEDGEVLPLIAEVMATAT